ncbi:RelA/SpoT domain-containing protein [Nitrososphaera viennensis]|uniref:Protein with N-terminal Rel_Spo-like domain n=2 Tax=Nitrososphaera viennensis TaxID=1034015 RepID=A0A060HPA1_9ARCH|nr:RelA/SpoT domain-containing protein [Nitrososphaera viennensis]AIC16940.1 Protein with N-terminal Rel_Spo-like domain [Nitrososphaera viennensis EN76]UVS68843.1 RelA/SpoT domain-containing protein [Nitrososphaera viennensis]CBX88950.1 protein with N-terminal Rel_Spo-like domain [Nitrososphaera phage Pro-Nvie1]
MIQNFPNKISEETATEQIYKAEKIREQFVNLADRQIDDISAAYPDAEVTARIKDSSSMVEKVLRKPNQYNDVSQLQDTLGVRVVTKDLDELETITSDLTTRYEVVSEVSYVDVPKLDGYRGYHLNVKDKYTGLVNEIQIRTKNQDKWADLMHNRVYKPSKELEERVRMNQDSIYKYANELSDYYYRLDSGEKKVKKPEISKIIRDILGDD